jgi:hypothetical protein
VRAVGSNETNARTRITILEVGGTKSSPVERRRLSSSLLHQELEYSIENVPQS